MITRGIQLYIIAWAAALLPFVATHVSYLLAASAGHVDWCMPYWDSCTSISEAARQVPEKIWFKVSMIPAALVTLLLWLCAYAWRVQAGPCDYRKSLFCMPIMGCAAALFLILYTAALGEGDSYRLMRRAGATLAFTLTYLAQLLLTRLLGELARDKNDENLMRWYRRLFTISMLMLVIGVVSVVLDAVLGSDYDRMEDAFEWILALLLNSYFAALALCWRRENARLVVSTTH